MAEDGAETVFSFPGEGVGPFAVNTLSRCFAVAEQCLNPKIYVFIYPTFREMSILTGKFLFHYIIFFVDWKKSFLSQRDILLLELSFVT